MAHIFNGKAVSKRLLSDIAKRVNVLPRKPTFLAITVTPSGATLSYLRMKQRLAAEAGIGMEVRTYETQTTEGLVAELGTVTEDAVIVQLPLPETIDTEAVLAAIPPGKDADVLSPSTRAAGKLAHPVAAAVATVFEESGLTPEGKRAAVVGQGWLVGAPVAEWLRRRGAVVSIVTKEEGDLVAACKDADIIVSGTGVAGLITPKHVRPGAAVIDVGTSELGGSLRGDVDQGVAEIASIFTPVPGGVGPVTVVRLLDNVVTLAELGVR
ncbi:MAG TPA: bifunctional 5,10-methylenetetrahydrofolate dehydrogenase/5,10-methenyltetrahydrofolate cyclohydrolase [Candidatus Paceibacterota bacterium]|jgi:methylenetetrahydrofolate dehydrogenase (NADP+)/methenyltetrahydrofolate cyclohydrolase